MEVKVGNLLSTDHRYYYWTVLYCNRDKIWSSMLSRYLLQILHEFCKVINRFMYTKMEGGIGYDVYTILKDYIEFHFALGGNAIQKEYYYIIEESVDKLPIIYQQAFIVNILVI